MEVDLTNLSGVMLIVATTDMGVSFRTQAGGVACAQVEASGIAVPFNDDPQSFERRLRDATLNVNGLTVAVADKVDEILASSPYTAWARVDRTRLADSREAWIYVVLAREFGSAALLMGFEDGVGVVTWPNSD